MAARSLIRFVEEELNFLIYTLLEWMLLGILFLNEFLSFAASELAFFFHMKIPCLLCSSNSDHVLVHKDSHCYCNNSICEFHKKGISFIAYCYNHKKLSDIRKMCEGCLLSFATEKESDCDTYKSLVGVLHKDLECFVGDDIEIQLGLTNDYVFEETSNTQKCSCCGQPLKVKRLFHPKAKNAVTFSQAPAPAPSLKVNSCGTCKQFISKFDYSELEEDDYTSNVHRRDNKLKEDNKAASAPLLTEADNLKDKNKTSTFPTANEFLGTPHEDFAPNSPRCYYRINRESTSEKTGFTPESNEGSVSNKGKDQATLNLSSRQVRLNRKPLMSLYMELDEERNASAVAANNAMAMITRLQAEKAAIQMEALQYQRLMEEEVEHDEESLRETNEMLLKREEEVMELENELAIYREKYGSLMEYDEFQQLKNVNSEDCQQINSQAHLSHSSNISPSKLHDCEDKEGKDLIGHEALPTQVNLEGDKTHLGRMEKLENKAHLAENGIQNVNISDKETGKGSQASLA